jgi:hypothetical protein
LTAEPILPTLAAPAAPPEIERRDLVLLLVSTALAATVVPVPRLPPAPAPHAFATAFSGDFA